MNRGASGTSAEKEAANVRVRTWFLATLAVVLLAGGCGKKDRDRETPLHWAAERGDIEKVQELIARGANVNARDNEGDTPLHLAAQGGHMKVVQVLLRCGARLDLPDKEGRTKRDRPLPCLP